MSDFSQLLAFLGVLSAAGTVLVVRGNLTIALRRKPQPRKPPEVKP